MKRSHVLGTAAAVIVVGGVAFLGAVYALNVRDETPIPADAAPPRVAAAQAVIDRGAYIARAGNCGDCHTRMGGEPYAGGRSLPTPFGIIYTPNITPDVEHGLGSWSPDHFWRALHNGRSKDGHVLYAAFPYTNYTKVTRDDSDALYAYLRSVKPVAAPNQANTLPFPFNLQLSSAVWRALFFKPGVYQADAGKSAEWNRGAYLVEGLGHCNACHAERNAMGATKNELTLAGGLIPVQNWYAPSLVDPKQAGVAQWKHADIVKLLKTGISDPGYVFGPMTEVVASGTQHLSETDLYAMATYLKDLPQGAYTGAEASSAEGGESRGDAHVGDGEQLYADRCAGCHGDSGEGVKGIYPSLARNRAVLLDSPANLIHIVLEGAFPPATAGNPRPFGMPPFATALSDAETAQVLSYVRTAWGNKATPVSALDVQQLSRSKTE